ncbi:unnamed protein product [Urochloa humidicola]
MPKKCLASIIADEGERNLLTWPKRLRIIQGVADGLAYLHGHPQMCIVHRDIKASNILLDYEMNAKITDFGFSVRLVPSMPMEVDLPVCGTLGYAAPDYTATGKISTKQDVYGFGIARKYQKKPWKLVDPFLHAEEHEMAQIIECVKVALLCSRHLAKHRPTMSEIVTMLANIKEAQPLTSP